MLLHLCAGLKITTNHGRSKHFQFGNGPIAKSALTRLSITPGTTITGLYASQVSHCDFLIWKTLLQLIISYQHIQCGLISLGVMSEVVK